MDFAAVGGADIGSRRSVQLAVGDVLVNEGDASDDVYLIVSGSLAASASTAHGDVIVGSVGAGQIVGEVTVIAGGLRTATLRATAETHAYVFDRHEFERWLTENPEIADAVSAQARERIDRTHVAAMVTELIKANDPGLVQQIVERVEWRRLEAGETLFEEGDASDAAYFIVGGRLLARTRDAQGGVIELGELGRGDVVGELGLLDNQPRSATVLAVRDTTLATLTASTFEALVLESPRLTLHVARGVIGRLRSRPRRAARASSLTIAITAPIDGDDLCSHIVDEIGRFGVVRHLTSGRVDAILNRPSISQADVENVGVPRLTEFMHEADLGNDHLVMQTDAMQTGAAPTGWTRRALRHADRVLMIVSARPDASERAHIATLVGLLGELPHIRLMLGVIHPALADRPRNTARLAAEFGADEIVHLRGNNAGDTRRAARLAIGRGVGVVLSGGGARGFAHLGVVRALRQHGVPIDAVGGCSMGASIGVAAALGLDDDELLTFVEQQFARLLDYTVPIVAMLKGERIAKSIEASVGTWDIEDLWLPFFCVSTNLTTSQLEIHRRGNATTAVRASVAIPGLLPPVPFNGDLLVDGGVLNNLPADVMRADSTIGTVIAVDVAPRQGPRASLDYGLSVSGIRALRSTLRRAPNQYPSLTSILIRSMLTGAVRSQERDLGPGVVDLMLPLRLSGVGLLDFDRVREVAGRGYDDSAEQVRDWVAKQAWLGAGR